MSAFPARHLPEGYERLELAQLEGAVRRDLVDGVTRALVRAGTLHDYAARHPEARGLQGRGTAYSVPLPVTDHRVVVRRSRHGGAFARFTNDRFIAPTRAPLELRNACRLAELGVRTPPVAAAIVYRAGIVMRRSDIATNEIIGGRDLSVILDRPAENDERRAALRAVGQLLATMTAAGAQHPDLNLKNILCTIEGGVVEAYVLDVDRVIFRKPFRRSVFRANLRRLARSARKWQARHGLAITESDLREIEAEALAAGR